MRVRRHANVAFAMALLASSVTACGSGASTPPTSPTPVPTLAPTPVPTPAGIVLPSGMVCDPTPPPLLRLQVGEWRPHGDGWVLDSSPVVPNVDHYCDRVGFGEWKFCFTRPEGDPQRVACDYLVTGKASDTGRWGPTWSINGKPCDGKDACINHPEEQFKAIARGSGLYEACVSPLVTIYSGNSPYPGTACGSVQVNLP
jgi:hypothetical protein